MRKEVNILKSLILDNISELPDSPVSMFLSGGLDSSLVLSMFRHVRPNQIIYTFTLANAPDHPDVEFAAQMATMFKTTHHFVLMSDADLKLHEVAYNKIKKYEYPGMINWYILCNYARFLPTNIVMTGEGGDECFGGYYLHEYPLGHKENGNIKSYEEIHCKPRAHIDAMISMGLRDFKFKEKSDAEDFNAVWDYYISVFKPEQLNPLVHVASHFGLTIHHPLYSVNIVKFMGDLPYQFRIRKSLQRELAIGYLPESIIYREKYNLPSALNYETWVESCKPTIN